MTLRIITHPTTGKQFHVGGRRRPPVLPVKGILPFERYLRRPRAAGLSITLPAQTTWLQQALAAIAEMNGNDVEGDCVIAEIAHTIGVMTGNNNNPAGGAIFTLAQINAAYGWCGYNGTPQTDNGCDIVPTLQLWQQQGFPIGNMLNAPAGWISVDPTNITQMQQAIYLFLNMDTGVDLPDSVVGNNGQNLPTANGFTWSDITDPPDPNNGHSFLIIDYNQTTGLFTLSTWGMYGYVTAPWLAKYLAASAGGELYSILMPDSINNASQVAPNGFDYALLEQDFTDLGGTVTPTPTPAPVPNPQPQPQPQPQPSPVPTSDTPVMVDSFGPTAMAQLTQAFWGSMSAQGRPWPPAPMPLPMPMPPLRPVSPFPPPPLMPHDLPFPIIPKIGGRR